MELNRANKDKHQIQFRDSNHGEILIFFYRGV